MAIDKQVNKKKTAVTAEQRIEDIQAMLSSFAEVWKDASGKEPKQLSLEAYELKATNN